MVESAAHEPTVEYIPADPASIATQTDYSHLRFSRGYVLHASGMEPDVPAFWKTLTFAGMTFRWDPRVGAAMVSDGETEVLICGHGLDPNLGTTDLGEIARGLHSELQHSRRRYLNVLEEMFGQYVVIDHHQGAVRAQTDAIASRSLFHDRPGTIIASHVNLVGRTLDRGPSIYVKWVGRTNTNDFPGRTTEFDDVWLLTPNTELTLGRGTIRRIGPLPYEPLTVTEAANQMIPILKTQVEVLKRSGRTIVVSASAGVDSRTSLAAFAHPRDTDDVQTFTYTKAAGSGRQSAELNRDKLAAQMSADLGLTHQMFDLNTAARPPAAFVDTLKELSSRRSNTVISWVYHSHLPHDSLHIRGQINGVGKWHFAQRLHYAETMEISARRMASLTKRGKDVKLPLDDPWWQLGERGFQEYIKTTKLRSVPAGYRMTDLFIWEHRVANWNHAHIVESDVTFDTYQLFGSRKMIRLMLSVPEIDRVQLSLFRKIIEDMEPRLLEYPLNGKTWDPATYELPLSAYQQGSLAPTADVSSLNQRIAAANGKLKWRREEIARLRKELESARREVDQLRSKSEEPSHDGT
ncbi:hypothetical protein [Nesterenkonia lutea]|uniref:Asparagine synthetase domain-containing protein n=1 Tax=Nesterenkonia lutea TaxID=272919 RepID=A0ABR9JBX2_9MICC|nr:hypothetical protein [Nesterenkonia lutea]MBE1523413.1 hypothetical protein [Nesterenkonia lutea]